VVFKAVAFEKPLYTVDLLRPNLDLYDQVAFVEM